MMLTEECEVKLVSDLQAFKDDPTITEIKYIDGERIVIRGSK